MRGAQQIPALVVMERVGKQWFFMPDVLGQDPLSRRRDPTYLGTVLSAAMH